MLDIIKDIFFKKRQNIKDTAITNSVVIQAGGDVVVDPNLSQLLNIHRNDNILLNQLVKEKFDCAIDLIIDGKSKDALRIIDTVYSASLKSISAENQDLLNYLKAMFYILENENEQARLSIEFIGNDLYRKNIFDAINIKENGISELCNIDEIKSDLILSYIILDILFNRADFTYIILNFVPTDSSYHVQDYFYALASLNTHDFIKAIEALDKASSKKKNQKYLFCMLLSQINLSLSPIQVNDIDLDLLDSLYDQLIEVGNSCPEFRDSNLTIFNMTKLRALLVLKPELFFNEYYKLSQELRDDVNFRFQLGTYYQILEQYQDAIGIYNEILSEEPSTDVFYRVMYCYLLQDKFDDVIYLFEDKNISQTSVTSTIYLIAIYYRAPNRFEDLFDKLFSSDCSTVDDLFVFLYLHRYSEHVSKALHFKTQEFKNQILNASKDQRILLAFFAAKVSDIELCKDLLASVDKYSSNNLEVASSQLAQLADPKLQKIVAEWFVSNNLKTSPILKILAQYYIDNQKYPSAFSLLQDSFELHQEKNVAVSLINLAALIDNVKIDDVQEYLNFISDIKEPDIMLITAQTYCRFGFYDKVEKLSYEAIYLLNNQDDTQLFEIYLSVYLKMLGSVSENSIEFKRVTNNVVVILTPAYPNNSEAKNPLIVCINQESHFCNDINTIGAMHVSKSNLLYLKLINKEVHDIIEFNSISYTVDSIIDKYAFCFRHILDKMDKVKVNFFKKISVDMSGDIGRQMQEVLRELGPITNLLDSYHNKENPLGLPIECINRCKYDDYVEIVQFLLYSKDEVLYAGLNHIEVDANQNYAITLSTLVLLKILNNFSLLDQLCGKIYIAETLLLFIKERSENASKTLAVSPGKLGLDENGGLILTPPDKSMPDFWNDIYEIALKFKICNVSNRDRFDFYALHIDLNLEELFIKLRTHICQVDSLILALKFNSILLSDDSFFRVLGDYLEIESVNHTYLYSDNLEALIKLLETNYLYIPPIIADPTFMSKYIKSISSNERKRRAYAALLPLECLLELWS